MSAADDSFDWYLRGASSADYAIGMSSDEGRDLILRAAANELPVDDVPARLHEIGSACRSGLRKLEPHEQHRLDQINAWVNENLAYAAGEAAEPRTPFPDIFAP